jgi:ubiquitin-activating enzyme E1
LADSKDWSEKLSYIKTFLSKVEPRPWTAVGVQVDTKAKTVQGVQQEISESTTSSFISDEEVQSILSSLPNPSELKGFKLTPIDFEKVEIRVALFLTLKDDDRNFHVDFVHTMSSLRATVYSINRIDRLRTKIIVGKIIPAIITATAFVAGLACLEIVTVSTQVGKMLTYSNNKSPRL